MWRRSKTGTTIALAAGLTVAAGCAAPEAQPRTEGPIRVAAAFYPAQFLAERIGGPDAEVFGVTPPGTEPHDLSLTGPARAAIEDADALFYVGEDYQPEVTAAAEQRRAELRTLDILEAPGLDPLPARADAHEHGDEHGDDEHAEAGGVDPHVWLDPVRFEKVADAVTDVLADLRPDRRAAFEQRRDALRTLHDEFARSTAQCASRTLITNHAAFGYLADRYDLEQVPIAGLSPEQEPAPATLGRITDEARRAKVRTVFAEEALSPELVRTVADEAGARVEVLAVLEFTPDEGDGAEGTDYLGRMRANAAALRDGLECT